MIEALEAKLEPETAGCPMGERIGTRISLRSLSRSMKEKGYSLSHATVRKLLKQRKFSLRVNRKTREAGADHPDRNRQFE